MNAKKKMVISLILFLLGAMALFADLSDNITVKVMGSFIEVRNYNDVPVTVSISIEYTDGDFTRFEHKDFYLGRKGFSNDTDQWSPPKGGKIVDYKVKSVKKR